MNQDMLELISIVISPILPRLFALLIVFILIVTVKLHSPIKE